MVRVCQSEPEKKTKREQFGIFFFECSVEGENDERDEKITECVSDHSSAHEFRLRRSQSIEGTEEKKNSETDIFSREDPVIREDAFEIARDMHSKTHQGENRKYVDQKEKNDRKGSKVVDAGENIDGRERKVFTDDEIRDSSRFGVQNGTTVFCTDDFLFSIKGEFAGFRNELGPVHMMSQIGRGRQNGMGEIERLDEESQDKEREKEI